MRPRQVLVVLTIIGLAGCGTARADHSNVVVTVAHRGGPPSGSRSESLPLARQVIAENVLPKGARRLPQHPIPPGLRQVSLAFGVRSSVDIYRLFALPVTMQRAATFLAKHAPAGTQNAGTGQSGGRTGITEMDVSYSLNRLPRGISSLQLLDTVVPGRHGGSLLRVDVQVIWYPRRSAAEYLVPGNFRTVKVDAWFYGQSVRHIIRTFSARGIIGRLARLLNSLPAAPGGIYPCPAEWATYQLTFEGVGHRPDVVVDTSGCASDTVSVGGRGQPPLADFGKLTALVGKIMHVGPPRLGADQTARI